jgi:pimeloyl-ACP methyl ester carboxylesterase
VEGFSSFILWMPMRKLFLFFLLTACTQAPTPTRTLPPIQVTRVTLTPPASTVTPTALGPSATTAFATPLPPTTLTITAPDGAQLAASFYPPVTGVQGAGHASRAPGVLLLHMYGGSRADWAAFAHDLQERGTAALALDLRGFGESPGPPSWTQAPADVRAAWETLIARPEVDGQRSAIVGASIGANLALMVGANESGVVTVIALSPGMDYQKLQPSLVMNTFGARPVLLVASQDDAYSYTSAQQLAALAPLGETYFFTQAGHGTLMFNDPALEPLLLDWLQKYVGLMKG